MFGESGRIGKVDDQVIRKLYEMLNVKAQLKETGGFRAE